MFRPFGWVVGYSFAYRQGLDEDRQSRCVALLDNALYPFPLAGAAARACFGATNYPLQAFQVIFDVHFFEQRFKTDKSYGGGDFIQGIYPVQIFLRFDADAEPDILENSKDKSVDFCHSLRALRQDLESMLGAHLNNIKYLMHKFEWYLFVEQVPHRLYEDVARRPPVQRLIENILIE